VGLQQRHSTIVGQQSAAARKQVHNYLQTASLDKDLKLKLLEVVDELDRTVKIREKFGPANGNSGTK